MNVIIPAAIELISSNVVDSGYADWDIGTTYPVDATVFVRDITPHKMFKCAVQNTGVYPPDDPAKWTDMGATNRWAMFDDYVESTTELPADIVVTIRSASVITHIGLFGLSAESVRVTTRRSDGEVVGDQTKDLLSDSLLSWEDYFFDEIRYKDVALLQVPGYYPNVELTVTIKGVGTQGAKCGHCVVGYKRDFGGITIPGVQISLNDYSVKSVNEFGEAYLLRRSYSSTIEADIMVQRSNMDNTQSILHRLRATPAIWNINNSRTDHGSCIVYGFIKNMRTVIEWPTMVQYSLEIEGLI